MLHVLLYTTKTAKIKKIHVLLLCSISAYCHCAPVDHGFYDITTLCVSHGWAKSMGDGDFRRYTAPRPLYWFWQNLKYISNFRTLPSTQNVRELIRWEWSGKITNLTHESFVFSFLRHARRSHLWSHPAHITSLCSFGLGSTLKDYIWNLIPLLLKNVTIGT